MQDISNYFYTSDIDFYGMNKSSHRNNLLKDLLLYLSKVKPSVLTFKGKSSSLTVNDVRKCLNFKLTEIFSNSRVLKRKSIEHLWIQECSTETLMEILRPRRICYLMILKSDVSDAFFDNNLSRNCSLAIIHGKDGIYFKIYNLVVKTTSDFENLELIKNTNKFNTIEKLEIVLKKMIRQLIENFEKQFNN